MIEVSYNTRIIQVCDGKWGRFVGGGGGGGGAGAVPPKETHCPLNLREGRSGEMSGCGMGV